MTIFRKELTKMEPEFSRVLPAHLPTARLTRTIESAVMADNGLLQADRASVWRACMTAATFGLEVDGRQSCIVRFKNKAQLIPMVSGLVTLAFQAGFQVQGEVVRKKDRFEYAKGLTPTLVHIPARTHERGEDNPIVAAYATARGPSILGMFEVYELPEIIAVRDRSSGYNYAMKKGYATPWTTDFPAMCRKTPIRGLCNHLPWQVQKTVELEGRFDREGVIVNAVKDDAGIVTLEADEFEETDDDSPAVAEAKKNAADQVQGDML